MLFHPVHLLHANLLFLQIIVIKTNNKYINSKVYPYPHLQYIYINNFTTVYKKDETLLYNVTCLKNSNILGIRYIIYRSKDDSVRDKSNKIYISIVNLQHFLHYV